VAKIATATEEMHVVIINKIMQLLEFDIYLIYVSCSVASLPVVGTRYPCLFQLLNFLAVRDTYTLNWQWTKKALLYSSQEGDIRKFLHTILENRHFVTDPQILEAENQNGPLETPVTHEITPKSGKSGSIPAKNGFFYLGAQSESRQKKLILFYTTEKIPFSHACSSENFLHGIFDFLHQYPRTTLVNMVWYLLLMSASCSSFYYFISFLNLRCVLFFWIN
jgi:hypothetical protein